MSMKKLYVLPFFLALIFFVAFPVAHVAAYELAPKADPTTGTYQLTAEKSKDVFLVNPLKGVDCKEGSGKCLMNFLGSILDFVILIGAIVVVLMTVFVGYKFVVAQGEPGKISEARQALLWTVVGALILLGSKAISEAITLTVKELGG